MRIKLILLCFVELVIGESDTKVQIGTVAKQGEFPFAVAILAVVLKFAPECTGVLVKPDMVMTAGHCFFTGSQLDDLITYKYYTIMGVVDIRDGRSDPLFQTQNIVDLKFTKGYIGNATHQCDTAAAFLEEPYEITEAVKLAKIVSGDPVKFKAAWDDIVKKKQICRGLGWGKTFADGLNNKTLVHSFKLRYVRLNLFSDEVCKKNVFKFSRDLCGKGLVATLPVDPEDSLGPGDSGGPLLCGEYVYGTVIGGDDSHQPPLNMFFIFFPFLEYFGIEGSSSASVSTQNILFNTYTIISLTIFLNFQDKYTIK